jgi:hypothetical protein
MRKTKAGIPQDFVHSVLKFLQLGEWKTASHVERQKKNRRAINL